MTYKIVNTRGKKVFPATFETKEQAKKYLKKQERIVGRMKTARITKTKKTHRRAASIWGF